MSRIMKKIDTFFYLVTRAFSGLFKNGVLSLASVAVLVVCLLVTGSFYLIIQNLNYNIGDIEYLNKIVIYLSDDASEKEKNDIYIMINNMEEVKKPAEFVSKETALKEEMDKHPSYFEGLEEGDNPYRDSIVITYNYGYDIVELEQKLSEINGVDIVKSRASIANTVSSLKRVITLISVSLFVSLVLVTVFIIITTVKVSLYARKDEIALMYTIGATRGFITLPFILEGLIIGLTSSLISFFLQWWIYGTITNFAVKYADLIKTLDFSSVSGVILTGFVSVGVITGIVGSTVSLGKYMERTN